MHQCLQHCHTHNIMKEHDHMVVGPWFNPCQGHIGQHLVLFSTVFVPADAKYHQRLGDDSFPFRSGYPGQTYQHSCIQHETHSGFISCVHVGQTGELWSQSSVDSFLLLPAFTLPLDWMLCSYIHETCPTQLSRWHLNIKSNLCSTDVSPTLSFVSVLSRAAQNASLPPVVDCIKLFHLRLEIWQIPKLFLAEELIRYFSISKWDRASTAP